MKGEFNMNNTCTASINTNTSVSYEKKGNLRERLKKYFTENSEMICAGLITMCGGNYIPPRNLNR